VPAPAVCGHRTPLIDPAAAPDRWLSVFLQVTE
jgi:hypothetical protein